MENSLILACLYTKKYQNSTTVPITRAGLRVVYVGPITRAGLRVAYVGIITRARLRVAYVGYRYF